MSNLRENFNQLFKDCDALTISLITTGSVLLASTLVVGTRAITSGSAAETFFKLMYSAVQSMPGIGEAATAERQKALDMVAGQILQPDPEGVDTFSKIPKSGVGRDVLFQQLNALCSRDQDKFQQGHISGAIYLKSKEHWAFLSKVQELFLITNPLHPDVFPAVGKFEREVVRMAIAMLNGDGQDRDTCGALTSGGTESIMCSMLAYRNWGRSKGILFPEIVVPVTAHAAFDKGAGYFNIKLVKVAVDVRSKQSGGSLSVHFSARQPISQMVSAKDMKKAINGNTVCIVGSAPQFPHGIIDPIEELAAVALEAGVGLHVDACLGGFLLPWLVKIGVDLGTRFDFSVKGVTSMSADTHKYGFTTKGTSVVLYSTQELKHHMYFIYTQWPGGVYCTATMGGSRPGALSVGAWASLVTVGEDGFVAMATKIAESLTAIKKAVANGQCGAIRLVGNPLAMVLAFDSDEFDIQRWASGMSERHWNLNRLQKPSSVHLCLTGANAGCHDDFVRDSAAVSAALLSDPKLHAGGAAALYGMAGSVPDALAGVLMNDICSHYLDTMTSGRIKEVKQAEAK